MSVPDYVKGDKAWAKIGTTKIKGLNALKVPGITRKTVEVEEFDRDFDYSVPTSAAWEQGSLSGNYVPGDTTGQDVLRTKLFNNEGLTDLRLGESEFDFWAPDLAEDTNSKIYVMANPGPDVTKSGVTPFSADILVQGQLTRFNHHADVTDFEAQVINGAGFIAAGFAEGDTIIIDNSTSNDTITDLVITAVLDGELTVSGGPMNVETVAANIHGGQK